MIDEILKYNEAFVTNGSYRPFAAGKYPRRKLAVLSCMDTRLVELLPAALGLRNGDVKLIKNAGGMITDPLDTSVRSLLIAILELHVEEVMVIAHTDCGVAKVTPQLIRSHLLERGITEEAICRMEHDGLDFDRWFQGFETPEEEVRRSVALLRNHPLIPHDIRIAGFVIDIQTGKLTAV